MKTSITVFLSLFFSFSLMTGCATTDSTKADVTEDNATKNSTATKSAPAKAEEPECD